MWSYSPEEILEAAQKWWNWTPHSGQRQWMLDTHPVKVAACGRRWGKTESLAVETAALALLSDGIRQVIVAPTLDQARILFDRTTELLQIRAEQTGAKLLMRMTPYPRLRVGNSEVTARSAYRDARSLRGRSAHRIVVDEAAYIAEDTIAQVLLPMLADTEGQLVLLSTPFGLNHFYHWYARGHSSEHCRSFRFPTRSNPRISQKFLEMQRQFLTERQFAIEYEASFEDDAGAVFAQSTIERCMTPHLMNARPSDLPTVAGLDWGRYRDYTALVILRCTGHLLEAIHVERLPAASWQVQVERLIQRMVQWHVRSVCCDATGIGDPLAEMMEHTLNARRVHAAVQPMVLTASHKRHVVESLALAMEKGRVAIPPHPDLLRELHAFSATNTRSGHVRLQARGSEHDDLVIALALAHHVAQRSTVQPAHRSLLTSRRKRESTL